MTWTHPKTWTAGEVVGETDLNVNLRDNLVALKEPPHGQVIWQLSADSFSYNGTAFTAIASGLSATINTHGGTVFCHFNAAIKTNGAAYFNLESDGSAFISAGDRGLGQNHTGAYTLPITGLPSGTHTFRPTWRGNGSDAVKLASGTIVTFWAREIS